MTHTRRLWALLALVLTLVLAACSTPEDLNVPTLEPQFGSADEDRGLDVASVSTGRIYSLSQQSGTLYTYDPYSGTSYENGYYTKSLLHRYDSSGTLVWTKVVASEDCTYEMMRWEECSNPTASTVEADTQGNVYAKVSYGGVGGDCVNYFSTYIQKFDATGNSRDSAYLGSTGGEFGETYSTSTAFTVDGGGNIYAALEKASVDSWECFSSDRRSVVSRYSTSGSLLWQRTSTVGTPYGTTASVNGSTAKVLSNA